jgi:DNA-binding NarL/FixJ family response regulator
MAAGNQCSAPEGQLPRTSGTSLDFVPTGIPVFNGWGKFSKDYGMPQLLIVDDNSSMRHIIRSLLEQQGYEICGEAEDGLQAIELAKQLKPDLILLDASMPKLGGPQVASVLKRMLPKSRIILFTFFDDTIGKELASAIGVDLVLSKTEGMTKLLHSVQTVMERNGGGQSVLRP